MSKIKMIMTETVVALCWAIFGAVIGVSVHSHYAEKTALVQVQAPAQAATNVATLLDAPEEGKSGDSVDLSEEVDNSSREMSRSTADRLFRAINLDAVIDQMMATMLDPVVGSVFSAEERELFITEMKTGLVDEVIYPVYRDNLTEYDGQQIAGFYESPAGKTLAEKLPEIMTQSERLGRSFGAKAASRAIEKARLAKKAGGK